MATDNIKDLLVIVAGTLLFTGFSCENCWSNSRCVPIADCDINGQIVYPCQNKRSTICCPLENVVNKTSVVTDTRKNFLSPQTCGLTSAFKIIGGQVADYGQFPWMALLGYKMPSVPITEFLCGGTLITDRYVLTAAHCINLDSNRELIVVRLGEHNLRTAEDCFEKLGVKYCADPPVDVRVNRLFKHPGYDSGNLKNDIALIKLQKRVSFSDFVKPICMPLQRTNENLTGQRFTISGWGKTNWRDVGGADQLQFADVTVWDSGLCQSILPPEVKSLRNDQFCANGKNRDACKGDSGGPLINSTLDESGRSRFYQLGIVSFSPSVICGVQEQPAVYTRVDKFIDWIVERID